MKSYFEIYLPHHSFTVFCLQLQGADKHSNRQSLILKINLSATAKLYNFLISSFMNVWHIKIIYTIYMEFSIKGKYQVIGQSIL